MGHVVSADTVGRLLVEMGCSLQAPAKGNEGAQHLDRGCTTWSGGRTIDINYDEELLIAARQARWTPQFRGRYR